MRDIEAIRRAVESAAPLYPIRRVDLFGSYARGTANGESDVDLLVEFTEQPVSLFKICGFQAAVADLLRMDVDVVKSPLQKDSGLKIDRAVRLYER